MRWDGSVAVVTGASRGIGAAVARAAAARGARVGLLARSKDDLDEVAAACPGAVPLACDVTDRAAVEHAIDEIARALGPVDVLVNNAGAGNYSLVAETPVEEFERLIAINYLGTVYATKAVLPSMLERARGHVVNIASINGRIGAPFEAAYSASKFAVAGLTDALMLELAGTGVGVSLINPGPVATDFFRARGVDYQRSFPKPVAPEAIAAAVLHAVEHDQAERFLPRWLRFPAVIKALVPPIFRAGAVRSFRKDFAEARQPRR